MLLCALCACGCGNGGNSQGIGGIFRGTGGNVRNSGGSSRGTGGKDAPAVKLSETPEESSRDAGNKAGGLRRFPQPSVPIVYDDNPEQARAYLLDHYWDGFLKGEGSTGAETILGVRDAEVEQALANYIQILATLKLESTPDDPKLLKEAQKSVTRFFKDIEAVQQKDTSSLVYLRLTELVSRYLYDPNSPMRDEDLYLPFVEEMLNSPCTRSDMRNAYRHELKMCRTNTYGSVAPDFRYSLADGHKGSLHAIKADYTMLFFSNPGCESCKEIIRDIRACGSVGPLMADGKLAIINIYIDEEIEKWREYLPNYPGSWINGYDYTFSLRDGGDYDIRAIPSLYLLDKHKRVIMKDAPTARVLTFLENIDKQ